MTNNEQLASYQKSRNRPDFSLYVTIGVDHALKMVSKDMDYLARTGRQWLRLGMIDKYAVVKVNLDDYEFT